MYLPLLLLCPLIVVISRLENKRIQSRLAVYHLSRVTRLRRAQQTVLQARWKTLLPRRRTLSTARNTRPLQLRLPDRSLVRRMLVHASRVRRAQSRSTKRKEKKWSGCWRSSVATWVCPPNFRLPDLADQPSYSIVSYSFLRRRRHCEQLPIQC